MDASLMSPALLCELSDLRRRAYGPDDGAAMDRNALRRLGELEGMLHPLLATDESSALPAVDLPLPELVRRPLPVRHSEPVHPYSERTQPVASAQHPRAAVPQHYRAQPRVGQVAAFVVATAVLLAGAALIGTAPRGAALLVATPATGLERQRVVDAVDLESFGLVGARLQQYEDFRGLSVWSAATAQGVTCLLVGLDADRVMGANCSPLPLTPSFDYPITTETPTDVAEGLPWGSVIRFVWDGSTVGVWIAESTEAW